MYSMILNRVVAPLWAAHERSSYLQVASRLEKEKDLSLDERKARQWEQLGALVNYVWENCPFYRTRLEGCGFEPGDLKEWEDYERLPVLTKSDIRSYRNDLVSRGMDPDKLNTRTTSGSTGVSLEFFIDEDCQQWKRGVELYRNRWTGWKLGDYRANVWGNPPSRTTLRLRMRNRLLERDFYLDTLKMNETSMRDFIDQVHLMRPTMLFGHAHSLYLLARFWKSLGIPAYKFTGVISTAMVLHDFERQEIESFFGPCVYDRYGCEEVSLIASECRSHEGMHTNSDSLVVEIVGGKPGETAGRVVVTDLINRGMPFLRYEVGDMAVESIRPCSCGLSYPLLTRVAGRIADYLIAPDGDLISGISLTENFATKIPGVAQIQIIQEAMHRLTLRIVPGPDFGDESRRTIQGLLHERFGGEIQAVLQMVDRIEPEPSGKYRFAICRISEAEKRETVSS